MGRADFTGPPAVVAALAQHVEIGSQYAHRLLADERMARVWQAIETQARRQIANAPSDFESRLTGLKDRLLPQTWWPDAVPWKIDAVDRAHCAVFLAAVVEFCVSNKAVQLSDIEEQAARWRFGALLCEEALRSPHYGAIDADLAGSLRKVAAYFEHWQAFVERAKSNDGVIGRSRAKNKRGEDIGDDARRGQVQRIARTTIALFDIPLAGTIATIVNVARDLSTDAEVTARDVENWCGRRNGAPS